MERAPVTLRVGSILVSTLPVLSRLFLAKLVNGFPESLQQRRRHPSEPGIEGERVRELGKGWG